MPAGQVVLDEAGDRAALDEGRQHLDRQAQIRRDARHVGLGAGGLHDERAGAMERLAVVGRQTNAHAGGDEKRVFVLFSSVQVP